MPEAEDLIEIALWFASSSFPNTCRVFSAFCLNSFFKVQTLRIRNFFDKGSFESHVAFLQTMLKFFDKLFKKLFLTSNNLFMELQ